MREFRDIGSFVQFMETMPAKLRLAGNAGLRDAALIIETEAKHEIGTYQGQAGPFEAWRELADRTKQERVELGFTENDPLLRTGALRDSIGIASGDGHAEIGSDSEIAVDQELGTRTIPPRSFLGGAAFRKAGQAVDVIAGSVANTLASQPRTADIEGVAGNSVHDIPF